MLFNSFEFVFAFLPVTLAGFFLLGLRSPRLALGWLTLASVVYYAWWRPVNVAIIAPSVLINYALALWLQKLNAQKRPPGTARAVLALGIVFNVCFLGYFKYVNFLATAVNDVAGTHFVLEQVILPLGISFITFQKIAFLVDVHGGRIKQFGFADYCLFVLFFPQLIAGPIVHYRELMPQFQAAPCRFDGTHVSVGLTLFVIGLFKKVVLADSIAAYVTPVYGAAAAGTPVSMLAAWLAAVGFTLQIYFDFSGYSDMAIGLARLFGIRLPPNFDSPLKATNIIDFWLRWHMTLTRFLTAYLYNPLVLSLTRRRMAKGLPVIGSRQFHLGAFVQMLVLPTLLTMTVSGIWHGAGYLFILWGALHGLYLVVNHGWRALLGERTRSAAYKRWMPPLGWVITFLAVIVAMVLFRAPTVDAAKTILAGLVGANGIALPQHVFEPLVRAAPALKPLLTAATSEIDQTLVRALLLAAGLLAIALVMPNSLQLLGRFEPAAGFKPRPAATFLRRVFEWQPTLRWAAVVAVLAVAGVWSLGGRSEFLYWQF